MADESTSDARRRFPVTLPPRSGHTPHSPAVADSQVVGAAELETALHRVDEIAQTLDLKKRRKFNRDDNDIDMTPMVDTTFLLLLFFMITAAFTRQLALQVPTPQPDNVPSANVVTREPEEESDTITVHVDENNTYRVVTAEADVEAPSTHELLIQLRGACERNSEGRRPTKLLVMANNNALHERVVAAMDAGSQVEMEEIQLMMVEENE
jgi:biopolymer transport protein ExbD